MGPQDPGALRRKQHVNVAFTGGDIKLPPSERGAQIAAHRREASGGRRGRICGEATAAHWKRRVSGASSWIRVGLQ
jgi:hypothetical protein